PLFAHPEGAAAFPTAPDGGGMRARPGAAPPAADAVAGDAVAIPPLVQLRRTWLMFESGDGIVYERFMLGMAAGGAASQALLFPLTLHLSPAEFEAFDANRETFARLGF